MVVTYLTMKGYLSKITDCMNCKMLKFDRIDVSEGIDVNKTNASKERDISHCWYQTRVLNMSHIFVMTLSPVL